MEKNLQNYFSIFDVLGDDLELMKDKELVKTVNENMTIGIKKILELALKSC